MNNTPNRGQRPNNRSSGRPPQQRRNTGAPRPNSSPNPNRNPNRAPNRPGNPRRMPPNPRGNGYGVPPRQRQEGFYPESEATRRRRELERRQAEARRQAMRDHERREKQRKKAERERRFRRSMVVLGGRLLVFAIILILLCLLFGAIFLLFFNHTPDEPTTSGSIAYTYGGSELRKTPIEEAVADGVVYVCFNDVADYLGMMESGSAEAMKFILPMTEEVPATSAGTGHEEIIVFPIGGQIIEINGQTAQLEIPNILRGTEVWVSSTFLTDYMNNLSYQYDERKSKVLISRILDEEASNEEEEKIVYLPVSFKLKTSAALDPLPEDVVPGVDG